MAKIPNQDDKVCEEYQAKIIENFRSQYKIINTLSDIESAPYKANIESKRVDYNSKCTAKYQIS